MVLETISILPPYELTSVLSPEDGVRSGFCSLPASVPCNVLGISPAQCSRWTYLQVVAGRQKSGKINGGGL